MLETALMVSLIVLAILGAATGLGVALNGSITSTFGEIQAVL